MIATASLGFFFDAARRFLEDFHLAINAHAATTARFPQPNGSRLDAEN
jgi:hypothetical protein